MRMKKMRDLAINPRKGRKKGKAVRIDLKDTGFGGLNGGEQ